MFDRSDIQAAIKAGAMSQDQAARLEGFLAARGDPAGESAAENLRFLANFNDVFITIGLIILAVGLTAVTSTLFGGMLAGMASRGALAWSGILILMPVAGVMWVLAEYFCRKRRLPLPSMLLTATFVLYTGLSTGIFASGISGLNPETVGSFMDAWGTIGHAGIASFLGAFGAAIAVYLRFRLPFSLLLVALSVAGVAYTFAGFFGDSGLVLGGAAFLLVGLATLAAAIWYDSRDPQRMTRKADNAFWLHLAAAPQIIWGLRSMIVGSGLEMPGTLEAFIIVGALIAIGYLSLLLNRRALIVAGLLTFSMALGRIVEAAGGGGTTILIATTLILGTGIVLLGGGWRTARRLALRPVKDSNGFTGRIFPHETA